MEALLDSDHPRHKLVVAMRSALSQAAHPDEGNVTVPVGETGSPWPAATPITATEPKNALLLKPE